MSSWTVTLNWRSKECWRYAVVTLDAESKDDAKRKAKELTNAKEQAQCVYTKAIARPHVIKR